MVNTQYNKNNEGFCRIRRSKTNSRTRFVLKNRPQKIQTYPQNNPACKLSLLHWEEQGERVFPSQVPVGPQLRGRKRWCPSRNEHDPSPNYPTFVLLQLARLDVGEISYETEKARRVQKITQLHIPRSSSVGGPQI